MLRLFGSRIPPIVLVLTFCLASIPSPEASAAPVKERLKEAFPLLPTACSFEVVSQDWDFATGEQGFYLISCDIEGGAQVWQHGDTNIPGAPPQVWGTVLTGNYPDDTGSGLASPSFTVTSSSYLLQVDHYFETEYGYDGCNIEVYPDYTVIEPIGGYTVSAISSDPNYYAYCVNGEPGWTGSSGGWRSDCFDLSPYMGRTISLMFDFGSDQSVTAAGWYLARVILGAPAPQGACCNFETGTCTIMTHAQCADTGGFWRGEGTQCLPNPCPQPCTMPAVTFDWDFSTGAQGFVTGPCDTGGAPVWEYGHTALIPDAPARVWGTYLNSNYPDNAGAGLRSPTFTVDSSSRIVEVVHYFDTEMGYDGCNLSIYPFGTVVAPVAGYTVDRISASVDYYAWCVDGEPGWTGRSGGWRIDCFDLSAFVGSNIAIEFDFGSDASVTAPGWYLARVRVGGEPPVLGACCNLETGACTITTAAGCTGIPLEWHGEWTTCSPNPCPQPIQYGGVTMGTWSGAEPWHDWIPAMPGSTVPIELHPGAYGSQIRTVDFYISTDVGVSWQFVGRDADGSEPHLNTTDTSVLPMGDGWRVDTGVPELPPDWPLTFKAVAHLSAGGDLVAIGGTSTDPAPPSLGGASIHDWIVTDKDTMGVEVDPNGSDIREIVVFRGQKMNEFTKGIPGIDQHILGNDYCAPVAAGECLKYFEGQGDNEVTGGYGNLDLCALLAQRMRTTVGIGTSVSNWSQGLASWIEDHGDGYTVRARKHYTRSGTWTWTPEEWTFMRNELERCQDVLLGVFWSTGGGHSLTLNSILNTALPNGRVSLDFKDPWTGQTSTGELDPSTGVLYNVTGAGNGHDAYVGATMVVSPKEEAVNRGGPGMPIYDGLPPGPPPYHIDVELPMVGPWFVHLVLVNNLGHAYRLSYVVVRENPSGAPMREGTPLAFALEAGAPNPFRYRTDLTYAIPNPSNVTIAVYDASGRKVRTLVDGPVAPGFHVVSWDGTDGRARSVAPGTYFVKMEAEGWRETRTITLVK